MSSIAFSLPEYPFDYQLLSDCLKHYRSPRAKIGLMLKKREIVRIKKGLYIRHRDTGGDADKCLLSNLVYGPSYVSLEFALSFYGLIPERVEEITAVTNKRNKRIETPVGSFTYKYLSNKIFPIGRELVVNNEQSFIIASREKAICDKIASIRQIKTENDVFQFLEKDLRIDWEEISDLDMTLLDAIKERYQKKPVTEFVHWYRKNIHQN